MNGSVLAQSPMGPRFIVVCGKLAKGGVRMAGQMNIGFPLSANYSRKGNLLLQTSPAARKQRRTISPRDAAATADTPEQSCSAGWGASAAPGHGKITSGASAG